MPLRQSRADRRNTGVVWPEAYGVVTHWNLQDQTATAVITVDWWASKADYDAGHTPVDQEVQILTQGEQQTGVVHLMDVLEDILLARTEYGSAVQVP